MVITREEMIQLINNCYSGLCRDMEVDPKPIKWLIMWAAVVHVIILVD